MKQKERSSRDTEYAYMQSPIGLLVLSARNGAVSEITLSQTGQKTQPENSADTPVLRQAAQELREYFDGARTEFTFPIEPQGTPFQKEVWNALLKIPYGRTKTYGTIAAEVGNPKASRAVGMACNKNPVMIAIPCHRVLGANGALTGYALGTHVKKTLLDLENNAK